MDPILGLDFDLSFNALSPLLGVLSSSSFHFDVAYIALRRTIFQFFNDYDFFTNLHSCVSILQDNLSFAFLGFSTRHIPFIHTLLRSKPLYYYLHHTCILTIEQASVRPIFCLTKYRDIWSSNKDQIGILQRSRRNTSLEGVCPTYQGVRLPAPLSPNWEADSSS